MPLDIVLGVGPLVNALVARVAIGVLLLPMQQAVPCATSLACPDVPRTVCTRPESASTPMCAFMPKCHWLPFLLECISGSRILSLFLVELGAGTKVASTTVPALSSRPRWLSSSLTVTKI